MCTEVQQLKMLVRCVQKSKFRVQMTDQGENLSCTNVWLVQKLNVWKLRTACIQVLSQRIKWLGLGS